MADDLLEYPGGQVQIANGDLQDATSAKFSIKNNAKLVHTLRLNIAGINFGNVECTGTIETVIRATGPERDYVGKCLSGEKLQVRFKPPGATFVFNGVIDSVDCDLKTGEPTTMVANLIGKISPV